MNNTERARERSKRQELRLRLASQFLGGKCVRCSATRRLQFDHIDPESKLFDISIGAYSAPEVRFWEEVFKCQLLCTKHHAQKSGEDDLRLRGKKRGGRSRRFTEDQEVVIVRRYRLEGLRMQDLADEYGGNVSTIHNVIHRWDGKPI